MSRLYIGSSPISSVYMGGKRYGMRVRYDRLLPIGYTQLKYIESTGTQYIDTGVSGGTNAAYEIKFNPLTMFRNYETYFGGDRTPPVPKIIYEGGGVEMQTRNGNHVAVKSVVEMNSISTIRYGADAMAICNGISFTSDAWTAGAGWGILPFCIARSNEETALYATMRLYYLKMWTDSILVRDFIPAKRNSDSKIGLYDTVSKTFFTDANGGNFTGGDPV